MCEEIAVSIPVVPPDEAGYRFHAEVVSATSEDGQHEVVVTGGFGLGHLHCYVALDGKRVFTVDLEPVFRSLIGKALEDARVAT